MPDIVGIGAVNLDYVISGTATGGPLPDGFDFGSERAVGVTEIERVLDQLGPLRPVPGPGGSALNTIASIAALGTDISVGYVGICGRSPTTGFSFDQWLSSLAIDRTHLANSDQLAGVCVSYTNAGERSLLTTPGANTNIMAHLADRMDELVPYLAAARVLLVTSFADGGRIEPLVALVVAVNEANPDVLICCDPGAMWSRDPVPDGVAELLAMTDWFLVNRQEWALHQAAGRTAGGVTVVKHPDRVELVVDGTTTTYENPDVLQDTAIVDDTGSGDAFAAGLLWSLVTPGASAADGVTLGMDLAREKLRRAGLSGIEEYPTVLRRFQNRLRRSR